MAQQLQQWRSRDNELSWLSMLVTTMEAVASPKLRALPVDPSVRVALEAHLTRSQASFGYHGSRSTSRH